MSRLKRLRYGLVILFWLVALTSVAIIEVHSGLAEDSARQANAPDPCIARSIKNDITAQRRQPDRSLGPTVVVSKDHAVRVVSKEIPTGQKDPYFVILTQDPSFPAQALYVAEKALLDSFPNDLSGCQAAQMFVPPVAISMDELKQQLHLDEWYSDGYEGQNIRIGVIDRRFDSQMLATLVNRGVSISPVYPDNFWDAIKAEPGETELTLPTHGSLIVYTINALAPQVTFFVAQTRSPQDTVEAAHRMMDNDVNIIVHAVNEPTRSFSFLAGTPHDIYRPLLQEAKDNGILWINSAGNMGVGYYVDDYAPWNIRLQAFHDPNKTKDYLTLMVPIFPSPEHPASALLMWQPAQEETGWARLYLNPFGSTTGAGEDLYNGWNSAYTPANPDQQIIGDPFPMSVTEIQWMGKRQTEFYNTDATGFSFDQLAPGGIFRIDPENDFVGSADLEFEGQKDGLEDGLMHIYVEGHNLEGRRIELYVTNAAPAEANPYVTYSLDPVVLAPADLPESFTIGAYDPSTNKFSWYSSRSNSLQYLETLSSWGQRVTKPDVVTVGNIVISDELTFKGTSAATAVAAGVAAVVASAQDGDFDPDSIRKLLTYYYVKPLDEQVQGRGIGRLELQSPGDNPQQIALGTVPWTPDNTADNLGLDLEKMDMSLHFEVVDSALKDPQGLKGTVSVYGVAYGEGFQSFTVEYARSLSGEPLGEWTPYYYPELDETDIPENLCEIQVDPPDRKPHRATDGPLFELNTRELADGDGPYKLRVRLCNDHQVMVGERIFDILVQNKEPIVDTIALTSPIVEDSYANPDYEGLRGNYALHGMAAGDHFNHYVIQAAPYDDANPEVQAQWKTVIGNKEADNQTTIEDICKLGRPESYGSWQVQLEQGGILGTFDTSTFDDGIYQMRLILCLVDGTYIEATDPPKGFALDNDDPARIEITSPEDDQEVARTVTISGMVGGEGFDHYMLAIVPQTMDDTTIPVPAPRMLVGPTIADAASIPDMDREGLCDISFENDLSKRQSVSIPIDLVSPLDTNTDEFPNGTYLLRAYVCSSKESDALIDEVTIHINNAPEPPVPTFEVVEPAAPLSGISYFEGTVLYPTFQRYILEVAPSVEPTSTDQQVWTPIVPVVEEDIKLDETICQQPVSEVSDQADYTGGGEVEEDRLGRIDTTQIDDGTYQLRLRVCADNKFVLNAEGSPDLKVINFEIKNKVYQAPVVEIYPLARDEISGAETPILGAVTGSGFEQYTVEIAQVDETTNGREGWQVLVGPDISSLPEYPDNLCDPALLQSEGPGHTPVQPGGLILMFDSRSFANGRYKLRVRECGGGDVIASDEITLPPVYNYVSPKVDISYPVEDQEVNGVLPIEWIAEGEGYSGYILELSPDNEVRNWKRLVGPALAENEPVPDDLCTLPVDESLVSAENGRKSYTLDTSNYPDGNYILQLSLCVDGESANRRNTVHFTMKNGKFIRKIKPETSQENPNIINLLGTVAVPENMSFEQYVIEIARLSTDINSDPQVNDDALTWQTIVGPHIPEGTGRPVDLCTLPAPESEQLGTYQITEGTLGVLYLPLYGNGLFRVRLRVCLGDETGLESNTPEYISALKVESGAVAENIGIATTATASTGPDLEIHDGSAVQCKVLTTVADGTPLTLVARTLDSTWYFVQTNEVQGWAMASQVYVINAEVDQLEARDGLDTCTVVSSSQPQTERIFFANDSTGLWQIYYSDGIDVAPVQLTTSGNNEYPSVSPDGKQVAFASDRDGNWEIYVMNADTGDQTPLTRDPAFDYRPAWSPDGKKLLFESDREGINTLYSMALDTHQVVPIGLSSGVYCCVDWAIDSQQIVLSSNASGNYDIYLASVDGSNLTNLTNSPEDEISPAWQPNGSTIVFQRKVNNQWQLFTIQTNKTGLRQLTFGPGNNTSPDWVDGQIVYSSEREQGLDLYVINPDGTNTRPVVSEQGSETGANPQ